MTIKRCIMQLRFWLYVGNGWKRAAYAKKKGLFAQIGDNCRLPIELPIYPKLVRLHNNVTMHRSVKLITHDRINAFLMNVPDSYRFKLSETLGPIEVMDNVYIGMNAVIMPGVKIGPNAIVSVGSVVATDVPENSIVAGVPAKVMGTFDSIVKIRALQDKMAPFEFKRSGSEAIDDETIKKAWDVFDRKKNKK